MTRTHRAHPAALAALLLATLAAPSRATMPAPDGTLPPEVVHAFSDGLFQVPDRSGLQTTASQSDWLVPIIMLSFPDSSLRIPAATLQNAVFDTTHSTPTGSLVDYYDWVTGGRLHIRGEVVATVMMPHPEDFYTNFSYGLNPISTPQNDWGLVHDAVYLADPTVDWNRYDRDGDGFVDMLWVVHAGIGAEGTGSRSSLWSVTTTMGGGWSNGGTLETADLTPGSASRRVRINRFSVLPELSALRQNTVSEIGVFCHEFGHALGLPDLYDTSAIGGAANVGPGCWSLMATGGWGGDGRTPAYPTHPGGWCMMYLNMVTRLQPANDTTVTVPPISSGGPVYQLYFQGEYTPQHFLLEQRHREGFDRNLPGDGLLITQVEDAIIGVGVPSNRVNAGPTPGLRVLEADDNFDLYYGRNRGDAADPIPGATNTTVLSDDTTPNLRTFTGAPTNLWIDDVQKVGSSTRLRLHVFAAGWRPIENLTETAYQPTMGFSRGRHAAISAGGDEYEAFSDMRTGISQILLRRRSFTGWTWGPSVPVSSSTAGAFDPTIAPLPGDGLAVAWSDLRDGTSQVYYRARLNGAWTPETRVSTVSGGTPAIAADRTGRVDLCWTDGGPGYPHIRFLTFPAASPGGDPLIVNDSLSIPSAPSIAPGAYGGCWMLWPDLGTGNYVINFARYSPDSGIIPRQRLTWNTSRSQPSVDVAVDSSDVVHLVWQQAGSGSWELHYQRRPPLNPPYPPDTVIVDASESIQNPSLFVDRTNSMHLTFERSTPGGQMVRYKRWRAGDGWDYQETDVSDPVQGSAGRVNVIAVNPGDVSVLYSSSRSGLNEMRSRRRRLDMFPLAVEAAPPRAVPAFRVGPSPLTAGRELVVSGRALAPGGEVELFDAAGRRVARAAVTAGVARFSPAQTRPLEPGLYFTRLRGGTAQRLVVLR